MANKEDIQYVLTEKGKELSEKIADTNIAKDKIQASINEDVANPTGKKSSAELIRELKELDKKIEEAKKLEKEKKKEVKKVVNKKEESKESSKPMDEEDGDEEVEAGEQKHGMGYKRAKDIRKKSFGSLLAEQEGGLGESLKKTLSLKTKAKITGFKESFDPLNIAKKLTFGSNWAPAMLGKLTGRSKEDTGYFANAKMRAKQVGEGGDTASKVGSTESGSEISGVLSEILTLLKKSNEDDTKRKEEENQQKEILDERKEKRHKELLEALGVKSTGKTTGKKDDKLKEQDKSGPGLIDRLMLKGGELIEAQGAKSIAKAEAEKLAKAEAEKLAAAEAEKLAAAEAEKAAGKTAEKLAVQGIEKSGAETATKVGKDAIVKSATKILGKTLGKTVAKSIPFLGIAAGAAFAADKLMSGDLVGAGLEFVGGAGSALTAIPASIASAARDVYNDVYGMFPEEDPNSGPRMKEIYDIVSKLAKDMISNKMEPKDADTDSKSTATPNADAGSGAPTTTSSSEAPAAPAAASTTSSPAASTTSTVSPVTSSMDNAGAKLNAVTSQNLDAKLSASSSTTPTSSVTTNNNNTKSLKPETKAGLPPVRNQEDTFQRMILNSTRIV